ncbi:MAG: hypothetical protein ACK47B_27135 [Armatimonadota bacterium]
MHTDRTTKILLGAIALGLWANVFRPALGPTPATAQEPAKPIDVNITRVGGAAVSDYIPVAGVTGGRAVAVEAPARNQLPIKVQVVR